MSVERTTASGGTGAAAGAGDGSRRDRHEADLTAPLMRFDLDRELEALRSEPEYREHDRNAKTLVKDDSFRMVLVALKAGARFDEGDPRGSVGIDVRQGRVSIDAGEGRSEVGEGEVAVLTAGHRWNAEASEESVLLLTLSWPPESVGGR